MTDSSFDRIFDDCIERLNRGERPEACLADYPQHAARLEPLLKAFFATRNAYVFTPSPAVKQAARERFITAMEKRRQPSSWESFFGQRLALTAAALVIIAAIAGVLVYRPAVVQPPIPVIAVQAPDAAGNFAFLVSDEVNAVGDFQRLMVTIDKVGILQSGNASRWIEFSPETREFDLTLLPGDVTQQLWRGNVPAGEYSKVIIYVSSVTGTLKSTGETLDIKLPGDKLQMDLPFKVTAGELTAFTYDLTMIKTGGKNSKYLLKPQIGESGVGRPSTPAASQGSSRNQTPSQTPAVGQGHSRNQTPSQTPAAGRTPSNNQTPPQTPAALPEKGREKPPK